MSRPSKIRKAPLFVGLASLGGGGVGMIVGGAVGLIIILLWALFGAVSGAAVGDASSSSGLGWILIEATFALLIGGLCGTVAGAIGGFLLGILFCFVRNRWVGAVGGALFGALTAVYLNQSSPAPNSASSPEIWALCGLIVAGGAVAGALLSRLLLRLLDQEARGVA